MFGQLVETQVVVFLEDSGHVKLVELVVICVGTEQRLLILATHWVEQRTVLALKSVFSELRIILERQVIDEVGWVVDGVVTRMVCPSLAGVEVNLCVKVALSKAYVVFPHFVFDCLAFLGEFSV